MGGDSGGGGSLLPSPPLPPPPSWALAFLQDGLQEKNPVRNFLDDPRRRGPCAESDRDRREGSRRHIRNWGGADFDKVKTGMEQGKAWPPLVGARREGEGRHLSWPVSAPHPWGEPKP